MQRRAKLERHEQPGCGGRDDQSQSRSALHAVLVGLSPHGDMKVKGKAAASRRRQPELQAWPRAILTTCVFKV